MAWDKDRGQLSITTMGKTLNLGEIIFIANWSRR